MKLKAIHYSFYLQLEERIDTLSKEARAHKTATESAQLLIAELREELQQVWIVYKVYLWPFLPVVRVAEWSKAPDSRAKSLARYAGSKTSGPRMWAWVRIPPLTHFFFFFHFFQLFFYSYSFFLLCHHALGVFHAPF